MRGRNLHLVGGDEHRLSEGFLIHPEDALADLLAEPLVKRAVFIHLTLVPFRALLVEKPLDAIDGATVLEGEVAAELAPREGIVVLALGQLLRALRVRGKPVEHRFEEGRHRALPKAVSSVNAGEPVRKRAVLIVEPTVVFNMIGKQFHPSTSRFSSAFKPSVMMRLLRSSSQAGFAMT